MRGTNRHHALVEKQLFLATSSFTRESIIVSWFHVTSTFVLLGIALVAAAMIPWWPARLAASLLGGLVMVRAFVLFHDFMHGSLLRESRIAGLLFYLVGLVLLAPPRHWRFSHNFHHAHVGKPNEDSDGLDFLTSDVGTFPLMTTRAWQDASTWQRVRYRVSRHPLTILFAFFTIFLLCMCLAPMMQNPRRYWDGSLAILAHAALLAALWILAGFSVAFFAFWLPYMIAAAVGAYLFYAQHNFAEAQIIAREKWTYCQGAMHSTSFLKMGPIMRWFTANIGYHHVHHLNPHIPFYRLPEAMAAIGDLQNPPITTLQPREVINCFRMNLWDADKQQMVRFR